MAFQREVTARKRLAKGGAQLERELALKIDALRGGARRMASAAPWADAAGRPVPAPGPEGPARQWLDAIEDAVAHAWDLHAMLRGAGGPPRAPGGAGGGGGAAGGAAGGTDVAPAVDYDYASQLAGLFPLECGVTEEELRAAYARSRVRHAAANAAAAAAGGGGGGGGMGGALMRAGSGAASGGGGAPSPRGSVPPPDTLGRHAPPPVALMSRAGVGAGAGGPGTGGAADPPSPRMLAAIRAAVAAGAPSAAAVRDAWATLRPGTLGQQIFRVLCHAGARGAKVGDICHRGTEMGFGWVDSQARRNSLGQSMRQAASTAVAKMAREMYALRLFPGVAQREVSRMRGPGVGLGGGGGPAAGGAYGLSPPASAAAAQQQQQHQQQGGPDQQQQMLMQQQQQQQQQAYYAQQQQQQYGGGGGGSGGGGGGGGGGGNDDGFFNAS